MSFFSLPYNKIKNSNNLKYISNIVEEKSLNDEIHNINRKHFSEELNNWLNSNFLDIHNNKVIENDEEVLIKDVCKNLFNDVMRELLENNYKIKNLNQFKEDLIYLIYNISRINE